MMPAATFENEVAMFAPSELIVLNGDRFAGRARSGNVKLPKNGASVSAADLGLVMLAAAILTCERSSAIRLEVREKKAFLGLLKVDTLYAEPLNENPDWPENSLEWQVWQISKRLKDDNKHEVENIIYDWLGKDSNSPWHLAVESVQSGLADRGALARIQERRLKVIKTTGYKMTVSTAQIAADQPISPIITLLENCQQTKPKVWKLLLKHIDSAINSRTTFHSDIDID